MAGNKKSSITPTDAASLSENQYFYEDEVYRFDRKGRLHFGLVMETFLAAYSDNEDEALLNRGEIKVAWHPNGYEEILDEATVGLADRTLMPGDVVRRMISGKDTQRGYCRSIDVKADVKVVRTRYVVKNVSADRLRPLIAMPRDNAVCLDSWVGSTKNVSEKLTLKNNCGHVFEYRPDFSSIYYDADKRCALQDANYSRRNGCFATTPFYPGQTLVGSITALEKRSKKSTMYHVESVEIEAVAVHWQCKALSDENEVEKAKWEGFEQPKCLITGDDLKRMKRLNLFESCMLQINDKSFLKLEDSDTVVSKTQWLKESGSKYAVLKERRTKRELELYQKHKTEKNRATKERKNETARYTLAVTDGGLVKKNADISDSDGWQTDSGGQDEDDDDEESESVATTNSSCSTPTPRSSPKRSPKLSRNVIKSKLCSAKLHPPLPKVGTDLVTEVLVVYSTATVVWQDGTIESGIPSTQLYPIHHLDEHEFFPGDFVLSGSNDSGDNSALRDYGVIQKVDHQGRTAFVKWFRTYTCLEMPSPIYLNECEVSVYDLKDHPDFPYRPGTIVIRVANFVGEDAACTAGQVIDNYPDGRIKVWWVNGHVSMCWPQDIFEVGQYDSDNNFWTCDSDDSWETESEHSVPGCVLDESLINKSQLSANLERARVALARLEEIFSINPHLQNHSVMRKLLAVYKECRYLDRLMGTTFFHEDNFHGLLERVRKGGTASTTERIHDQKNRLFSSTPSPKLKASQSDTLLNLNNSNLSAIKEQPAVIGSNTSITYRNGRKRLFVATKSESNSNEESSLSSSISSHTQTKSSAIETAGSSLSVPSSAAAVAVTTTSTPNTPRMPTNSLMPNTTTTLDVVSISPMSNDSDNSFTIVVNHIGKGACQKVASVHDQDSGRYSHADGTSTASGCSSNDLTAGEGSSNNAHGTCKRTDDVQYMLYIDPNDSVCAKLCALLKEQLVKTLHEINIRYCQTPNLSEVVEGSEVADNVEMVNDDTKTIDSMPSPEFNPDISLDDTTDSVASTPIVAAEPHLDAFIIMDTAPPSHKFHLTIFQPVSQQHYYRAIQKEHKLLRTALPPGVWVRAYEDRVDLLSVMIEGPKNTPYEDGMFLFDIQLGSDYPRSPPLCHYISYCSDRLNPNLYEDGKVCVSLLGTWSGRGSEIWGSDSTILQVIVSIQGLILVAEPYFNEAGYEKQKGTQQGQENSRMYNEMAVIKMVQSMTKLLQSPPEVFRDQIVAHFQLRALTMYTRIKGWMELSNDQNIMSSSSSNVQPPEFPLVPASRGFCLTLVGLLEIFYKKFENNRD